MSSRREAVQKPFDVLAVEEMMMMSDNIDPLSMVNHV